MTIEDTKPDSGPEAALAGLNLEPLEYGDGWCVKVRDDGEYCIDVLRMAFNYRIMLSSTYPVKHRVADRGFCYFGHGHDDAGAERTMETACARALHAAVAWSGYGAPEGYDKEVGR